MSELLSFVQRRTILAALETASDMTSDDTVHTAILDAMCAKYGSRNVALYLAGGTDEYGSRMHIYEAALERKAVMELALQLAVDHMDNV